MEIWETILWTAQVERTAWVSVPVDGIILKVWQNATLQPSYLQRLPVPLWKDLSPVNIVSAQETGSILKIGFTLSKWLHFNSDYVIGVGIFFAMAIWFLISKKSQFASYRGYCPFGCSKHCTYNSGMNIMPKYPNCSKKLKILNFSEYSRYA